MKYRCRCNKRNCQARRNLNKHPGDYKQPPKCHIIGCDGTMYLDKYRQRKGPKDNAPVCRDQWCNYSRDHFEETGVLIIHHRVSTRGCSGYEDYVIERSLAASKHSPKKETSNEAPF